jgi:hypothetical protein
MRYYCIREGIVAMLYLITCALGIHFVPTRLLPIPNVPFHMAGLAFTSCYRAFDIGEQTD